MPKQQAGRLNGTSRLKSILIHHKSANFATDFNFNEIPMSVNFISSSGKAKLNVKDKKK